MNLDFENIDQLFEDSLEGMEITPSPKVKLMVQKNMFWHNAVKSILFKAGLSVVTLMTVVGAVWYANSPEPKVEENAKQNELKIEIEAETTALNENVNTNTIAFNTNQIDDIETEQVAKNEEIKELLKQRINSISTEVTQSKEIQIKTEQNIKNDIENRVEKSNSESTDSKPLMDAETVEVQGIKEVQEVEKKTPELYFNESNPELNENNSTLETNQVSREHDEKKEEFDLDLENQKVETLTSAVASNDESTDASNNEEINQQIVSEQKEELASSNKAGTNAFEKRIDENQLNETEYFKSVLIKEEDQEESQIKFTNPTAFTIDKMPLKSAHKVENTELPSLDLLEDVYRWFEDTVGININGEPIVLSSDRWSLGFYGDGHYTMSRFKSKLGEQQDLSALNKAAISPSLSYGFGAEVSYQFKQLSVGLGIQYERYEQSFSSKEKQLNFEQINTWNVFDVDHWQVDSTAYLNIDSLWAGDTVLVYVKDSVNYQTKDSTLTHRTDSNWTESNLDLRNVYQYFEIPVFVDYTFNRSEKWQPYARLGLVTGIYLKSKASILMADGQRFALDELPFAKVNFWGHLGLGIKYNLNKKWTVYSQAHYKFNINAILKDDSSLEQSLDPISLRLGIQFHF